MREGSMSQMHVCHDSQLKMWFSQISHGSHAFLQQIWIHLCLISIEHHMLQLCELIPRNSSDPVLIELKSSSWYINSFFSAVHFSRMLAERVATSYHFTCNMKITLAMCSEWTLIYCNLTMWINRVFSFQSGSSNFGLWTLDSAGGHAFHQCCSESWLSRVGSCPLCRSLTAFLSEVLSGLEPPESK